MIGPDQPNRRALMQKNCGCFCGASCDLAEARLMARALTQIGLAIIAGSCISTHCDSCRERTHLPQVARLVAVAGSYGFLARTMRK
jgi:hypothetical protein